MEGGSQILTILAGALFISLAGAGQSNHATWLLFSQDGSDLCVENEWHGAWVELMVTLMGLFQ